MKEACHVGGHIIVWSTNFEHVVLSIGKIK